MVHKVATKLDEEHFLSSTKALSNHLPTHDKVAVPIKLETSILEFVESLADTSAKNAGVQFTHTSWANSGSRKFIVANRATCTGGAQKYLSANSPDLSGVQITARLVASKRAIEPTVEEARIVVAR